MNNNSVLQNEHMTMIIFIPKKDTLQIMAKNKQYIPNLTMPVESYKKLIWLIMN